MADATVGSRPKLVILHLEDDPFDVELVGSLLDQEGFETEVVRATNEQEFRAGLQTPDLDLILADYSLPRFDGLSALEIAQTERPSVPFIMFTGTLGEEVAIDSVKAGATDYVLKQRVSRLLPAITRAVEESRERAARKTAEKSLRETEMLLEAILDASPTLIAIRDLQGRFIVANRHYEALDGAPADDRIGKTVRQLFSPEVARVVERCDARVLESSEPFESEETLTHFDGTDHTYLSLYFPLLSDDGKPRSICCISTDITQRKNLESQLRQAQKLEAIGQLAGGVAHDFNNILQAIFTHVDLGLRQTNPDHWSYDHLTGVRDGAERAASLTRQLLAFSRRQVLQPRNIDLNQLIESLLKMLRRIIGEDVSLSFISGSRLDPICVDPGQMEQVIMNLVLNARDAMPDGGQITIETGADSLSSSFCERFPWASEGQYTVLTVSDTGEGMDEKVLAQIFEPFFTTKEPGKGTGLGLATVYGIVRQHDGIIDVESESDRGTKFRIYIPSSEQESIEPEEIAEGVDIGGSETVLFAEDDDTVRRLTAVILKQAGYTVVTAPDGTEAVSIFEDDPDSIDLALLDVVLPGLAGREVHDRLRQVRPELPVLFCTGYSSDAIHTRFVLDEGMHLIQKPFAYSDLLRRVRESLDDAGAEHDENQTET